MTIVFKKLIIDIIPINFPGRGGILSSNGWAVRSQSVGQFPQNVEVVRFSA